MSKRYALSDAQWERIKDLLPGQAGQPGATARTTACSSMPCCTATAQASPGATCQRDSATFASCIPGTHAGAGRVWQRVFEAPARDADNGTA